MMPADLFVTFEHLHSIKGFGPTPGFCHRGARALCLRYGLDWAAIVAAGGIEAADLLATGDALAQALVEQAAQIEEVKNGR